MDGDTGADKTKERLGQALAAALIRAAFKLFDSLTCPYKKTTLG